MSVMEKLKIFAVQEPVVAVSCLIAGVGLFLPAVVRPMLDSFESSKQVLQPALCDVVTSVTGKKTRMTWFARHSALPLPLFSHFCFTSITNEKSQALNR